MENIQNDNKTSFITDKTKKICICTFISMSLIILFIITPLSNFFITSIFMKSIAILILAYAIYLNTEQSFILQNISKDNKSKEFLSQLNINIICSYTFSIFLIVLLLYTVKSFF